MAACIFRINLRLCPNIKEYLVLTDIVERLLRRPFIFHVSIISNLQRNIIDSACCDKCKNENLLEQLAQHVTGKILINFKRLRKMIRVSFIMCKAYENRNIFQLWPDWRANNEYCTLLIL